VRDAEAESALQDEGLEWRADNCVAATVSRPKGDATKIRSTDGGSDIWLIQSVSRTRPSATRVGQVIPAGNNTNAARVMMRARGAASIHC
jgi:hypothetical protein